MTLALSETEARFVETVKEDFRFLVEQHGFREAPLAWDGRGISQNHIGKTLEVSNYLEDENGYTTLVFPLQAGARLPIFDSDMDEPFSYFEISDLPGSALEIGARTFGTESELLAAVRARADALRAHAAALDVDDGTLLAEIRDRRRARLLGDLIPSWVRFVDLVRRKNDVTGSGFVASVNNRGAIRSLINWPGKTPTELERSLREADAIFDAATEPIDPESVRVLPHPRALRWFRRPTGASHQVNRELPRERL